MLTYDTINPSSVISQSGFSDAKDSHGSVLLCYNY